LNRKSESKNNELSEVNTTEHIFILVVKLEEWRRTQPVTIIFKNGRQVKDLKGNENGHMDLQRRFLISQRLRAVIQSANIAKYMN
jgi:hypothetical protein